MKRYYGSQQNVTKPVEKITLDDRSVSKKRIFFIALFLCIGIGAFVYAFTHLGGEEKGWQKVTLDKVVDESSYFDFTLSYEFGKTKKSVKREKNALSEAYKSLCREAYILFDRTTEYDGMGNLCTVNRHPNETVTVEPALYKAFETYAFYSTNRLLYLNALTEHVEALVSSDSDEALSEYDPYTTDSVREFFNKTAEFAMNPESVQLELCGDNRVILHVSQEYITFAKENDIANFIDFGWMKNAFICDFLADSLIEKGFRNGILTSSDGFTRNFCESTEDFSYTLVFYEDGAARNAGTMNYQGKMNFVWLHDYPVNTFDRMSRVLMLPDGNRRHTYIGRDGMPKSARHDLLVWSPGWPCANLAISAANSYISDEIDLSYFLKDCGYWDMNALFFEDGMIHTSDWSVTFINTSMTVVKHPVAGAE